MAGIVDNVNWKLVYSVRDFKNKTDPAYNIYEDNKKTNTVKGFPNTKDGYYIYVGKELRFVIELHSASGILISGKNNLVQYLKAIDPAFKDRKLAEPVAEKLYADFEKQFDKKNHSFVPKEILIENGMDPKYLK